ncbi:DUF396-domain-containing protein [Mycena indigotica]|uniref:DUF396-domain-containing protein n=1 Tax=Mycena indigotica TaxID=2126181 RepID=A0A8H6SN26_9AGAR|nr:DUF396-domain-containing protein [Mycena indigotica]KAF7301875.1 DUF396-domain-containing protein [Mycena indigotica]
MGLLFYLSYGAAAAALAFIVLSLASGLLYCSELIEEHSKTAKTVGQRAIYVIIVLHGALYLSDSLPPAQTAFSVFCHLVYLQNFSDTWPVIELTSWSFMASCVFVIMDHFLWFNHFARISQEARHSRSFRGAPPPKGILGFSEISTFFGLCVWAAPLFLFLSLSANDNTLPMSGAAAGSESSAASNKSYAPTRVSLFRSLLPFRSKSARSEGILTPHSPGPIPPPRSPLLRPHSPSYSSLTPPRSPRHKPADFDTGNDFTLSTPPKRGLHGESGLGQRRSILPQEDVFGSE